MITDDQLQLITAAIDGELTPVEERKLRRLLESSPEARAAHARLKADSDRLHQLPRVTPPADLQARVMRRVAAVTPPPILVPKAEPAREREPLPRRKLPAWVPATVAASLLLGVTGGSFWFFNRTHGQTGTANQKRPAAPDPNWNNSLPSDTDPRPSIPAPRPRDDGGVVVRPDTPHVPVPPVVVPDGVAVAPEPRSVRPDLVAFPPIVTPTFDHVRIRIPLLKAVADLDRPESRQELAEELGREPPFRIDLFTRTRPAASRCFQAPKAAGVNLLIDATTHERARKGRFRRLLIYSGIAHRRGTRRSFGKLASGGREDFAARLWLAPRHPVTASDNTDLKNILGVDPASTSGHARPRSRRSLDPTKPISSGTADRS